jgi:hypothetical protein
MGRTGRFSTGDVAQLGERGLCKPEVVGSIPIISTKTTRHGEDGAGTLNAHSFAAGTSSRCSRSLTVECEGNKYK